MFTDEQEGRKAGRPRSIEAHQAILDATLALLSTQGFDAMSIEEVATRAGVGKTTIYRWWDSKETLALEALQHLYAQCPIIDTGNLRHDLVAMIEDFIQLMEEKKPLLEGLIFKLLGDLKTHPELFQMFHARIVEPRLHQFLQLIEHAQERGELRKDLDPSVLFGVCGGHFFYRVLFFGKMGPSDVHRSEQVVEAMLNGIAVQHEGCNCVQKNRVQQA